eukprot:TRINITY_DN48012_c0_g1_i1.p1 TRINITY_DN48012_c0_g1~~TRINITY_DN48012_c0_g1_i1.p1  ORF type:complete len:665 (-),score=229.37 TRINITY_DN48012_c0_g1_i1:125-2119(-)
MKQTVRCLVATALVSSAVADSEPPTNPIAQIVTLLEGMKTKAGEEKAAEKEQYTKYKAWCEGEDETKTADIKEGGEKIEELTADIQMETTTAAKLAAELATLDQQITEWTANSNDATATRKSEKAAYDQLHKDYSESITATTKASELLTKELASQDEKGDALALLQKSSMIPKALTQSVSAFLQGTNKWPKEKEIPDTTSSILQMIDSLKDKFNKEREAIETEETGRVDVYDKYFAEVSESIASAKDSVEKKTAERNTALETAQTKTNEKTDTQSTKKDDEEYLAATNKECAQKATDFESRTKLRAEELEALDKAIEIVGGIAGVETRQEDKRSRVLLQKTSLASLRASSQKPTNNLEKVANFLREMSDKYDSSLLSTAAQRAESGDPFARVKEMIDQMVKRLEKEGMNAESKFQWCEKETGINRKARNKATLKIEELTVALDEANARTTKLKEEITELNSQLAANAESFATAKANRLAEKKENRETIKDSKQAMSAVTKALEVLKEFYSKAKKATALVQTEKRQTPAPAIFDEAYKGAQSGGVTGLLDVVYEDYARLFATTSTYEEKAEASFETLESETKILKIQQDKDVEHKTKETNQLEENKANFNQDLTAQQKELKTAEDYYKSLKEDCTITGPTHAEMEARRKEEIDSLTEALGMLTDV